MVRKRNHATGAQPFDTLAVADIGDVGVCLYDIKFVAFCNFFPCSLTIFHNEKVGVDNEKALELTNSTVFHRGRQQKSSRAGQQNNFFIFQPDFNEEISPKNATKHPVA